jgi:membrane-associated phospholipid phosphatase
MSTPRTVSRLTINEQVAAVAACTVFAAALGRVVGQQPTALDRAARRVARSPRIRLARPMLAPLFPIGLPGAYIPIAYATAFWIQHRLRHGGPAIVAAAWAGWLGHRAAKIAFVRSRPSGKKPRLDSYPSGHTTGATALALTIGHVLAREGLLSLPASVALAVGASGIMGVSRVVADDHWITDVIGGWLFGGALGGAVCALSDALTPR